MTAPEPQAPPQTGGGQDSTILSAADGARLVGIIQKMNARDVALTVPDGHDASHTTNIGARKQNLFRFAPQKYPQQFQCQVMATDGKDSVLRFVFAQQSHFYSFTGIIRLGSLPC